MLKKTKDINDIGSDQFKFSLLIPLYISVAIIIVIELLERLVAIVCKKNTLLYESKKIYK